MLVIEFETREAFHDDFVKNISRGGLFVPTSDAHELRSVVEVGIALRFCNEHLVVEGEVVHCVPESLGSESVTPGVAVQLSLASHEIYDLFTPFTSAGSEESVSEEEVSAAPPSGADRRDSPRGTARIQARLSLASGEELEGLTRNLSASGILFSVTRDAPEVGARVNVSLLNPVSLEQIEIQSEVVHHIEGEAGDVPAIGVRFGPAPEDVERTRAFLKRLGASEHSRRLGGISGDLAELGTANLVQSFGCSTANGTIALMRGNHEGYIVFAGGMLVACRLGRVRGVKALARMLAWEDGRFEFHARVEPDLMRDEPVALDAAIFEAMTELDEGNRDTKSCFAPGASFELNRDVAESLGAQLGKVESAILDLVGVGANVRRLLDVIPEPDAKIQRTLANLVDLGAIRERS